MLVEVISTTSDEEVLDAIYQTMLLSNLKAEFVKEVLDNGDVVIARLNIETDKYPDVNLIGFLENKLKFKFLPAIAKIVSLKFKY